MFINDIHIFYYLGIAILGLIIGKFLGLVVQNLPEHKKIFSFEVIKDYIKSSTTNYTIMLAVSVLYIAILRIIGIEDILKLVQFLVITPFLITAFYIDYKMQIIPNRLSLTIFELGLIFSFIRGISNLNVGIEMWIGMFVGGAIFLVLTLLGNIIFRKETMGFGDVKLMGALGLLFGWRNIIAITILSFFIAAIYSIVLFIVKKFKKEEVTEFIPFGPFIVVATFVLMFIPLDMLIKFTFFVFSFGKYNI